MKKYFNFWKWGSFNGNFSEIIKLDNYNFLGFVDDFSNKGKK